MTVNFRRHKSSELPFQIDNKNPINFVDWLKYQSGINPTQAFTEYTQYIKDWYAENETSENVTYRDNIKNNYIQLLKQITIEYATEDEKRFLQNFDYQNDKDLDIVLPFYANKIKQICIYYTEQRESIKHSKIKSNLKGSSEGIQQILYNYIADLVRLDPYVVELANLENLSVSKILEHLKIDVEELYDTTQDYYNIPSKTLKEDIDIETSSQRYKNFETTTLPRVTESFIQETYEQAVIDMISKIPVLLETDSYNLSSGDLALSITSTVTMSDIDRLGDELFEKYNNNEADLNYINQRELFKDTSGTDFYYVSAGESNTSAVSGKLFSASKPHANLLNKHNPTLITAPGEHTYKRPYVGGFFDNNHVGVLLYTSLDFKYNIKNVKPNKIYYFSDPTEGCTSAWTSKQLTDSVIQYTEIINWGKQNTQQQFNHGMQMQVDDLCRFTGYQSTINSNIGISRSSDSFDFWTNSPETIWTQQDIYPLLDNNIQDISTRANALLPGNNTVTQWRTDIYGNNFGLYKENISSALTPPSHVSNTINDTKSIPNTSTPSSVYSNNITGDKYTKMMQKEHSCHIGSLYLRNSTDTGARSITDESVSTIFNKYQTGSVNTNTKTYELGNIYNELTSKIINFDIIYDILIVETESYIVFEKISYDYENSIISNGTEEYIFIDKYLKSSPYDKSGNWWFDEPGNRILYVNSTVFPELSSTSDRMIHPELYVYDINNNKLIHAYIDPELPESEKRIEALNYTLSEQPSRYNIESVKPPILTYNRDSERYIITQIGSDPADNIFYLTTECRLYDNTVEYINTNFYKNSYTIFSELFTNENIRDGYIGQNNTTLSTDGYYHDQSSGLLYFGCDDSNFIINGNSTNTWLYGKLLENFVLENDLTICFDYALFLPENPQISHNGVIKSPIDTGAGPSVIFFNGRNTDVLTFSAGTNPQTAFDTNYTDLTKGGLGTAFGYLSSADHTGLDNGYAAAAIDLNGTFSGISKENSIVVRGPMGNSSTTSSEITHLDDHLVQTDITDVNNLTFYRCKVTLTDIGRKLLIQHKKLTNDKLSNKSCVNINDYTVNKEIDITELYDSNYLIPERLKVGLTHNTTSTGGCIMAIKQITVTGNGNMVNSQLPVGSSTGL